MHYGSLVSQISLVNERKTHLESYTIDAFLTMVTDRIMHRPIRFDAAL